MKFLLGGIYLFLFFILMYLFGLAITRKKNYIRSTLTGYIVYTAIMSIGIIPMQLLNIKWIFVIFYFFLFWSILLVFTFLRLRNFCISFKEIKKWWHSHYFLYVIMGVMTILIFLNLEGYWANNHLDDAYYLTKVSTLPYLGSPFLTNYPVGALEIRKGLDTYLINTWETEAAIYASFFHIPPVLFCRLFLALQNYYIFLLSVVGCAKIINSKMRKKINENNFQYFGSIIVFFGGQSSIYTQLNLFLVQDFWQYNSAMYYGAALVRTVAYPLFIVFFINELVNKKSILKFIMFSIFLISKSTIALPILFVLFISWVGIIEFGKLREHYEFKRFFWIILCCLLIIGMGWVLPNNLSLNTVVINHSEYIIKFYFFIISLVIFILSPLLFREGMMRINIFIIFTYMMMITPEINDIFELFSVYDFVGARALSSFMYMLSVIGYIYMGFIFAIYFNKISYFYFISTFLAFAALSIGSHLYYEKETYGHTIFDLLSIIKNNSNLTSNTTEELSKSLNDLSQNCKIVIESTQISDEYSYDNGFSALIRGHAPSVIETTLNYRFPVKNEELPYYNFKEEDQSMFDEFDRTKDPILFAELNKRFHEKGINAFILVGDIGDINYSEYGYSIYKKIKNPHYGNEYTIFIRE